MNQPALYDYQLANVARAEVSPGNRWCFSNECQVGKTPECIEVMRRKSFGRILIVCPALVRLKWLKELDSWWPGHPEARIVEYGRERKLSKRAAAERDAAYAAPIQVVSYALAHEIPETTQFDAIVLDEAHRLKSTKPRWSRHVKELVRNNPQAAVYCLTATVIADRAADLHNIVDICMPGRLGSKKKFAERYQLSEADEYAFSGKRFYGVNPAHADELRQRLAAFSSRTTRADIKHLLPPYDVRQLVIQRPSGFEFDPDPDAALFAAGKAKLEAACEWAEDALESATHIALLTHHKELARDLAAELESLGTPIFHTDGDAPAAKRVVTLDLAKAAPYAIVVATMDSVGEGISLPWVTQALFVELHWRLLVMIQALGRFAGIGGEVPASCTVMLLRGTLDEVIAARLEEKVAEANAAVRAGAAESALESQLKLSDTNWLDDLRNAAASIVEGDGYLE